MDNLLYYDRYHIKSNPNPPPYLPPYYNFFFIRFLNFNDSLAIIVVYIKGRPYYSYLKLKQYLIE